MARVTVEDCVLKVPNRFELVLLSSQRARDIASGAELTVDRDNDKDSVVSLREIADETIDLDALNEVMIRNHQKVIEVEEDEDDIIDLMDGEMDLMDGEVLLEAEGMHETTAEDMDALDKKLDDESEMDLDDDIDTDMDMDFDVDMDIEE